MVNHFPFLAAESVRNNDAWVDALVQIQIEKCDPLETVSHIT